jgi:predicted DNA-binding ribbon-helix-helix protein
MKSTVVKRSIVIEGHKTSISIEDIFWNSLKEIARDRAMTLSKLVASIDTTRVAGSNLSSAIRVYVLDRFRSQVHTLLGRREDAPGVTPQIPASVLGNGLGKQPTV